MVWTSSTNKTKEYTPLQHADLTHIKRITIQSRLTQLLETTYATIIFMNLTFIVQHLHSKYVTLIEDY